MCIMRSEDDDDEPDADEQDTACPVHGEYEPCYKCKKEDREAARIDRAYDERRDDSCNS